jgi:RHS repeat-associated protein
MKMKIRISLILLIVSLSFSKSLAQKVVSDSLTHAATSDTLNHKVKSDTLNHKEINDTLTHKPIKDTLQMQPLLTCSVTAMSPSSVSIGPAGGQVSPMITITTSPYNCTTYYISNPYPWIHTNPVPGRLILTVDSYYGPTRQGTLSVDGRNLTVTQTCGSNPVDPSSISVNRNNFCANAGGTITLSAVGGSGVYTRWYSGSCGGTQVAYVQGASANITAPTTTTTYYGRWETGCGNSGCKYITVTVNQPQSISISGETNVCQGSTYQYTATSGLTGYNWSIPSGASGSSTTNTINVTFGSMSGTVSVSATDGNGCATSANRGVTVTSLYNAYIVSGGGTTCPGVGIPVYLQGSTSGVHYRCYLNDVWQSGDDIIGNGGNNVTWNKHYPGTYTIKGINGTCAIPMSGSATIYNLTQSTAPTGINATVNPICQGGAGTTLTVNGGSLGSGANWKWYTGGCGTTLANTGNSYVVNPSTTTTYWVRAEGNCNTTTCASITITVTTPPSITQQPQNVTICDGAPTSFSISASGGISYQWQNLIGGTWSNISGATSTTYSISNTTGMNGRGFRCVVTGTSPCNFTTTSNAAYIQFSYLDPYTVHSQWTTICPGDPNEITLDGSSTNTAIWYTCYLNGNALNPPVHDATGQGRALSFGNHNVAGTYTVKAQNTDGCWVQMNGSPSLTVRTPSTPPTSINATQTSICPGGSPGGGSTLTLQGGSLEPGYGVWKWYSGGTPCGTTPEGTNTTSITVSPTSTTTYSVRAEGGCVTTSCANTTVNVKPLPTITGQPVNTTISLGQDASFSVTATGPNLQYQWQVSPDGVNWTDLSGLPAQNYQTANLTIKGSSSFEDNLYDCKITSDCSTIYSNAVKIILYIPGDNYISPQDLQDPESRQLNTGYKVGSSSGTLNVNPIGGSSYNIPIEVPSGINGLIPSLSIVYSSNSGPGVVGYGWQIGGISSINRGPENIYNDGATRGIGMDVWDRFYLDGQRLINTSGTYGDYSTEYRTESDIFTRVIPQGMSSSGPTWFKAETKSGLVYEYGNSAESVQKINGYSQILNWYVSKISDLFGNQMLFTYIRQGNVLYPSEINYGQNKIVFNYSTRSDQNFSYIKGTKLTQSLILSQIIISYNSNIIKKYQFNHSFQGSIYNWYSILNEIVEYGISSSRYNSTLISYQIPSDVSFSQTMYNTSHEYITYKSRLVTGDFNGDGKADFLCLPDPDKGATWTGMRIYFGDGADNFPTYISSSTSLDNESLRDIRAMDLNADGVDDIVYEYADSPHSSTSTYYYIICTGESLGEPVVLCTNSPNLHTGLTGKAMRWIEKLEDDNEGRFCVRLELGFRPKSTAYMRSVNADYNGDGINDIFINDELGNWRIYSLVDQNGNLASSMNLVGSGIYMTMNGDILSADFNGDGKAEIWSFDDSGVRIYEIINWSLLLIYSSDWPSMKHFYNIGDFNGDGKADIFLYGYGKGEETEYDWSTWQIQLSTGTGFEQHDIYQKKTNLKNDLVRLGDFNGDGATDVMVTAKNNSWQGTYFYMSANGGTAFHTESLIGYPQATHNYYLGDFDGDGREDFICTDGQSEWWNGYQVYRSQGNTGILMEKVSNGLGVLSKLKYVRPAKATSSQYQKGSDASYPVVAIYAPWSVVTSIKTDNGNGAFNTQKYYYEGAKMHMRGKGFLGFAKSLVTDSVTSIESVTIGDFDHTYFYPIVKKSFTRIEGLCDTINVSTNIWANIILDPERKRIFPYTQSSTQVDKLTGHSVSNNAEYDNYGNITSLVKTYQGGPIETTTNVYENIVSSSKWLLGRPTSTTLQYSSAGNSTISRTCLRTFNQNNTLLTDEVMYSGTNWQLSKHYDYFSDGNLQTETATANSMPRTKNYTYESDNIRVHTSIDHLSHTTTNTYDSYGRLYTQQDFLGNTTTNSYDDFGGLASVSSSDGSQSGSQYYWEDPATNQINARYSIVKSSNDDSESKTWYDELGRTVRSDVKGFDGTMIYSSTVYNDKGQVESVSEPYFAGASPQWNTYEYDDYGRQTALTRPSGRNTTWSYEDNDVTEVTNNKSYTKSYSADGTVSSATDPGGTINYSYYPDGKVKAIVSPAGVTTALEYDIAGNQTSLTDPTAGTITYTYNGFGELTSQTNPGSIITSISYLDDGRISQKLAPEGTTKYRYNSNKQLVNVGSPRNISRTFGHDTEGRVILITDTIPGSDPFITSFTFDLKGRNHSVTHPSGITEIYSYINGYLNTISTGLVTRWSVTEMNARGQVTQGTYGSNLNTTNTFNDYGYLSSIVTGTIQNYSYNFNAVTGNLDRRQNNKYTLGEDFEYDDSYRLKYVRGIDTLHMNYDNSTSNVLSKSDLGLGTFRYENSGKPYQLSSIDSSSIPLHNQEIIYTSFNRVDTMMENNVVADFIYNDDHQRARMEIKRNDTLVLTRWYPSSSYIKESTGTSIKEFTFVGGDAYSAPVVAIKENGHVHYYYLLRDHLGSITHVVDSSNTLIAEYSYDAWGRMRNPQTWEVYAPGSEPSLSIAGRGFTGHEHLPNFNTINMNGRLYDPLIGMFLSPDNNVQSPDNSSSLNRYSYCWNNPLLNNDPSGEFIFTILAALFCPPLIPAAMQVDASWMYGGMHSWANGGSFWDGALKGGVTGLVNAGFSFLNVPGLIPNGFLHAGTNVLGNGISNALSNKPFFDNWEFNAGTGFAGGAYSGYKLAQKIGFNPLTGGVTDEQRNILKTAFNPSDAVAKLHTSEYLAAGSPQVFNEDIENFGTTFLLDKNCNVTGYNNLYEGGNSSIIKMRNGISGKRFIMTSYHELVHSKMFYNGDMYRRLQFLRMNSIYSQFSDKYYPWIKDGLDMFSERWAYSETWAKYGYKGYMINAIDNSNANWWKGLPYLKPWR